MKQFRKLQDIVIQMRMLGNVEPNQWDEFVNVMLLNIIM